MSNLKSIVAKIRSNLTKDVGQQPLGFGHYGHNRGHDAVCGSTTGKVFPHGEGIRPGYAWCPKCQTLLQGIHGKNSFQNPPPLTREEWENTSTLTLTLAELREIVEALNDSTSV